MPNPCQVATAIQEAFTTTPAFVESSFTKGFAGIQLLGPATEVCRDGKERAKIALEKLGIEIPHKRLALSLIPAHGKKSGNHFDLAFAISMAQLITHQTAQHDLRKWMFLGELGLDGQIQPVRGIVAFYLAAQHHNMSGIITGLQSYHQLKALRSACPEHFSGLELIGCQDLEAALHWVLYAQKPTQKNTTFQAAPSPKPRPNFDDMLLGPRERLLAETIAVGLHSFLLRGPPGTGKSMFASRIPSILPPLSPQAHLSALKVQSLTQDQLSAELLAGEPPIRSPHHQASSAAILGTPHTPGEIALAHGGMLFLDELPEFRRDLLEALREPLEHGVVMVSRAQHKTTWQAEVLFAAACNNCPCGWFGSAHKRCQCSSQKRLAYQARLSGPILDRIHIHFQMQPPPKSYSSFFDELSRAPSQGQSHKMRLRVQDGRDFGYKRNQKWGVRVNSQLPPHTLLAATELKSQELETYLSPLQQCQALTSRSLTKTLQVARSLADLEGCSKVKAEHIEQAVQWFGRAGVHSGVGGGF